MTTPLVGGSKRDGRRSGRASSCVTIAVLVASFSLSLPGCASLPEPEPEETEPAVAGQVVTREDIVRSRARTLLDVLRCCTDLRLSEGRDGRATAVIHRGSNSMLLSDTPLTFLDGTRVGDFTTLATLPADDVQLVRVYSASEAAGRFGFGADNGVIEIVTRRRPLDR